MLKLSNLEASWQEVLKAEFSKEYFIELNNFLNKEKEKSIIYPPEEEIFSAFNYTPLSKLKVVIMGQDPYHGAGQSHGLAFSVKQGIKIPPSLRNIFKELHSDIGMEIPTSGYLKNWAENGVLLLNATLTVKANNAGSHQKKGWETFTNEVIKLISEKKKNIVFLLWGKYAQSKASLIDGEKHHILKAVHPSPLSAYGGFFGCEHFSKTNKILKQNNITEINWNVRDNQRLF